MLEVKKEGIILEKTNCGFEMEGVLNPAVVQEGDTLKMFYRAVGKGNYSSVGFCRLNGPMTVEERLDMPVMIPQMDYESHGVEDPRISRIDDLYYLSYAAYDGVNALGALATSTDLEHFEKQGLVVPKMTYNEFKHLVSYRGIIDGKYSRYNDRNHILTNQDHTILVWDKNVIFFPGRINGYLCFLHRVKPDIQIVFVIDLCELTKEFWEQYFMRLDENIVLSPRYKHEVSYIGGGCPPIETASGWILIYHGVHDTTKGYVYSACAALLDLEHPCREIARLPYPLFKPEKEWELKGEVNNVCFPTGTALFGDTLYIYYGAADERIATASLSLSKLLEELLLNKITNEK